MLNNDASNKTALTLFRAGSERLGIGRGPFRPSPIRSKKATNRSDKRQTALDIPLKDLQLCKKLFRSGQY